MTDLIFLFKWTLVAGVVFSASLALLGSHLAARDRAMQTVCVSQGAMFGVLLSLGVVGLFSHEGSEHSDPVVHFVPFGASIFISAATFFLTDRLARRKVVSKNTLFASIFAVLLASSYLVSALFPTLENHVAQIYFGDLATATEMDAMMTLVLGVLGLAAMSWGWRAISNQSFELALFGETVSAGRAFLSGRAFDLMALVTLCFSVQFMGFLFTIACLFLPTMTLSWMRTQGLRLHFASAAGIASLGTLIGFLLSLQFTRLPTVPTISLSIVILGVVVVAADLLFRGRSY